MKPNPKPRRKTATIPKASGPDPAALPAASTASGSNGTSGASRTSRTRGANARAGKEQLSLWMDADVLGRARTAWRAESVADVESPYTPFGQWVAAVIETAVIASERRHNNGIPYRPTPKGQIGRSQ